MTTGYTDSDGAGDWTVAGYTAHYSPKQWADLKSGSLAHRRSHLGPKLMWVSDTANPVRGHDLAAIGQYIIGYTCLTAIVAVILTITALIL